MKEKVKSFSTAIGFMGVAGVCQISAGMLIGMLVGAAAAAANRAGFRPRGVENLQSSVRSAIPVVFIIASLFTIFLLWLIYYANRKNLFIEVFEAPAEMKIILFTIGLGIAGWCVNFALVSVMEKLGISKVSQSRLNSFSSLINKNTIVLYLASVGCIAPIAEEILFRGVIFQTLKKEFPMLSAIIIQAVLFGIFHLNLVQGVYATLLGLILGYVTYYAHSLWPAVVVHITNNIMGLMIGTQLQHADETIAAMIALFTVGAVTIGLLLFFITKNTIGIYNANESDEEKVSLHENTFYKEKNSQQI